MTRAEYDSEGSHPMNASDPVSHPTTALAELVAGLDLEAVPDATRARAKQLLLDAIGCAIAAGAGEELAQVEAFADALGDGTGSTVLGSSMRRALPGAVLVNGYRVTATTVCDVYTPAHCHLTPEVLPPTLGIGERERSSGAAVLRAWIAGLEVAARAARGLGYAEFRKRGWHAPGVVGPFGGAASVASLLGLDAGRTRNALALAGSQSAGTWAAWGTPAVKFHQARGALSGLLGGLLAAQGFPGAEEILMSPDGGIYTSYAGGGDPEATVEGLGQRWEIDQISLRRWPSGTPIQPVITALFALLDTTPIAAEQVERVIVGIPPNVHRAHDRFGVPDGTFVALLSIRYAMAVILHDRDAWLPQFSAARYGDPVLARFIERVDLVPDESLGSDGARVELVMTDGAHHARTVEVAKGHPRDPLSAEELVAKVHLCADGVIGGDATDDLIERVLNIEEEDDIRGVLALTRPSG
jgi:2-methylcitrate dehydratase PrpD